MIMEKEKAYEWTEKYLLSLATVMLHNTQSPDHSGMQNKHLFLLMSVWIALEALQIGAGLGEAHFQVCGQLQASQVTYLADVGGLSHCLRSPRDIASDLSLSHVTSHSVAG